MKLSVPKQIVLFIVFLTCSCQNNYDDVSYTIINNSSKEIKFTFNNEKVTLQPKPEESEKDESEEPESEEPGESKTPPNVKTFTFNSDEKKYEPQDVEFIGHPRSIKMNSVNLGRAGIEYNFIDVSSFDLFVINTLPVQVTIKADDYIDDEGETELTIDPSQTINAKIYTNNPVFSITADYPVIIEWKFSGETVNVIIR